MDKFHCLFLGGTIPNNGCLKYSPESFKFSKKTRFITHKLKQKKIKIKYSKTFFFS